MRREELERMGQVNEETLLERMAVGFYTKLGMFSGKREIEKYLKANYIDKLEIIDIPKNITENDNEYVLYWNDDERIDVMSYRDALQQEIDIFDCCIASGLHSFNDLQEVLHEKYGEHIKVVDYSIDTKERKITDEIILEFLEKDIEEAEKKHLSAEYVCEDLLQLDGSYEWVQREGGFIFKGKYILINYRAGVIHDLEKVLFKTKDHKYSLQVNLASILQKKKDVEKTLIDIDIKIKDYCRIDKAIIFKATQKKEYVGAIKGINESKIAACNILDIIERQEEDIINLIKQTDEQIEYLEAKIIEYKNN